MCKGLALTLQTSTPSAKWLRWNLSSKGQKHRQLHLPARWLGAGGMCQDAASALGFGTLSTAAAPTPGELCPLPTQRAGVPNLQDLMPDDLNIRNKVCNKCDALNQPKTILSTPTPGLWKNCLPQSQFLVPERLETCLSRACACTSQFFDQRIKLLCFRIKCVSSYWLWRHWVEGPLLGKAVAVPVQVLEGPSHSSTAAHPETRCR